MKNFALHKQNYIIIAVSVLLIILGFILMYGSKTEVEFNPDVFSFRRITLAPIVCMAGFVLMIFGIMWKKKEGDN
ncbi:MAG: DUF3098 domain-containing protein [bacterium]|uniref:DUF3098 domain-containing protein n=1 Tax=Candidatus Aphodosoma intestinipullorum TaxID=2840674 RepID=A0A940IEA6_9BACT|nr:DUF3098 domain-containing protein [Candidatus Aphodosoma intestinipullorum]